MNGSLGSDRFFCGRGKDTVVLEPQIFFRSDLLTLVRGADADQLSRADFKFIAIKSQSNICSGLAAPDSAQLNLLKQSYFSLEESKTEYITRQT